MEIRSKRQVMVDELQAELKDAYFKPNKLTEIDSDPRWRTLDAIAEYKEIQHRVAIRRNRLHENRWRTNRSSGRVPKKTNGLTATR